MINRIADINKRVYRDLENILQALDIRLYINMYAIVKPGQGQGQERILKLRRSLSDEPGAASMGIDESPVTIDEMLRQLGLPGDEPGRAKLLNGDLDCGCHLMPDEEAADEDDFGLDDASASANGMGMPEEAKMLKRKIIYSREIGTAWEEAGEEIPIRYLFVVEEADHVTRKLFYEKPRVSFLRMVLDYFFIDYYVEDSYSCLLIGSDHETRYKENATAFCQRMVRLFMGKMQSLLTDLKTLADIQSIAEHNKEDGTVNSRYYINDLLERVDGIATKTYEGDSPFGCIMLLNKNELVPEDGTEPPVRYSVQFHSDNRVSLSDTRRIRKLLELTNNENDFYLIGDEHAIYGIGEIDWKSVGGKLLIKIEFKGISNYDVMLVSTGAIEYAEGTVRKHNKRTTYEMTARLDIFSEKLVNVAFKKPEIGEGGFTEDRFRGIVHDQFKAISKKDAARLEELVLQAKGLRHGTMIVITEPETAKEELRNLNRQSTPIVASSIRPEIVKHLTTIDGAIYFDTLGVCHAIGVILDGEAAEHLGDASRGARYNSAFRYMNKLKSKGKPCVIAIISEDGMVNLIPEPPSEATIRNYAKQLFDAIHLHRPGDDMERIERCGRELRQYDKYIDYSYYYRLAESFMELGMHLKALEYFQYAAVSYEDSYGDIKIELNRGIGRALSKLAFYSSGSERLEYYQQMIDQCDRYMNAVHPSLLLSIDYSRRGTGNKYIGLEREFTETDMHLRTMYLQSAIDDFTEAIERRKSGQKKRRKLNITYAKRAAAYRGLNRPHESIEDIIEAELDEHRDEYISFLMKVVGEDMELFQYAMQAYRERSTKKRFSKALEERLAYYSLFELENNAEAAAGQDDLESDEEPDDILT